MSEQQVAYERELAAWNEKRLEAAELLRLFDDIPNSITENYFEDAENQLRKMGYAPPVPPAPALTAGDRFAESHLNIDGNGDVSFDGACLASGISSDIRIPYMGAAKRAIAQAFDAAIAEQRKADCEGICELFSNMEQAIFAIRQFFATPTPQVEATDRKSRMVEGLDGKGAGK